MLILRSRQCVRYLAYQRVGPNNIKWTNNSYRKYETEVSDFISAVELGSVEGMCRCMLSNCKVCNGYRVLGNPPVDLEHLLPFKNKSSPFLGSGPWCDIPPEKDDYICKYCNRTVSDEKCGSFCCK